MKYIKPTYTKEMISTSDIILASMENGTRLTETKEKDMAQIITDISYILGF